MSGYKRCCAKCTCKVGILQFWTLIAFIIYKNCTTVFIFGSSFLTKEPKNFECYDSASDEWKSCTKQEICSQGLPSDQWRPVEDDEYIDNWVSPEKLDLLCEPKYKIGLLGSLYFAGVVVTILWVPIVSDRCCGRRLIFLISMGVFLVAFLGLIWSHNLIETYVYLFILGACFAGRIVIGLTYLLELMDPSKAKAIVVYFFLSEPILLILLTMWYQFIDRSWFAIFIITWSFIFVAFLWYLIFVPESPKWLYTFKHYNESRKVLLETAEFNGVTTREYKDQVTNKQFYKEDEDDGDDTKTVLSKLEDLPQRKYILNVIILTIIWTNSSFSMYTLNYMNKRYEGSMFVHFYLDGVAGIIGTLIAAPLYNWLKIRWSFITIISLVIIFVLFYTLH